MVSGIMSNVGYSEGHVVYLGLQKNEEKSEGVERYSVNRYVVME